MLYSRYFIPTLKETPSDAEVISHQLMLRAGMIRKLSAGIYNYLPLGLRSIRKFENIVREEMNRADAIEMLMPSVQPAELWQESGRWQFYGKELLRFKDRKELASEALKRAEAFFIDLQYAAEDWIALKATKTGTVYRLLGNPPKSHE